MYSDYEGRVLIEQGVVIDEVSHTRFFGNEGFVYEVIRVLDGQPLLIRSHLERLKHSIELMAWPNLENAEVLMENIKKIIALNDIQNQNIKIRVDLWQAKLHIVIYPIHSRYPAPELYQNGALTGLYNMERHDPNAKAFDHTMATAREMLQKSGLQELLLVNSEGCITEGSKSNVVFLKGKCLYTAPEKAILLGITRSVLKHAIEGSVYEWIEEPIHRHQLEQYEGAFLTGTSIHLLPIHQLDHILYKTELSPIFHELNQLFINQIYREHEEDFK